MKNDQHTVAMLREVIALQTEIITSEVCVLGQASRISRAGLSTSSNHPLVTGSNCEVRVSLEFSENRFSERLPLRGTIAWCTPVSDWFQIGIAFDRHDPAQAEYLDLFVGLTD